MATKHPAVGKIPVLKKVVENRERHVINSQRANNFARWNAERKQREFEIKRKEFVKKFGDKKVKDLTSDMQMTNRQALAKTYLSAFSAFRYGPIESGIGVYAKEMNQLRDFVAYKMKED